LQIQQAHVGIMAGVRGGQQRFGGIAPRRAPAKVVQQILRVQPDCQALRSSGSRSSPLRARLPPSRNLGQIRALRLPQFGGTQPRREPGAAGGGIGAQRALDRARQRERAGNGRRSQAAAGRSSAAGDGSVRVITWKGSAARAAPLPHITSSKESRSSSKSEKASRG
jgi:hypothetical protein